MPSVDDYLIPVM